MSEWVRWHEAYDEGGQLALRLEVVQSMIRSALDRCRPGPIQIIGMCAGDGRDLLGVLEDHPRRRDVHARLVELDPELANRGRAHAAVVAPGVEVVCGDASTTSAHAGAVPADIVLVCGVFGNIRDEDVQHTIQCLPALCAPDATVIWTRGTFAPDLTPTIREWFTTRGFSELAFVAIPNTTAAVGSDRLTSEPQAFVPDVSLFTFLARDRRPSQRGVRL
ncbi:MAG: class I SAM-dependent methyltransferase [Candidatus Dormiibacterota bacterium]